jgi:membrane protein
MTSASELYGVIGGVILFITWLYFGAVIILLGAATNVVLADDAGLTDDGGRTTMSTAETTRP